MTSIDRDAVNKPVPAIPKGQEGFWKDFQQEIDAKTQRMMNK
jgi:hypothetical protein